MEFTGERVVPGQVDPDLWQEHLSRYVLAANWVKGKRVLDAGCGCGYGSALLAATAAEVIGVDAAQDALDYAREHYREKGLAFQQGDCAHLPFPAGDFGVITAFELIEHLPDADAFLNEMRRVLRPGGKLLVSTPNRRYYTDEHAYKNPFHTREFDPAEFDAILARHFEHRALLEQNHVPAICFSLPGQALPLDLHATPAASRTASPHFLLAICSDAPLPPMRGLVSLEEGGNVLREREQHIKKLETDVASLQKETSRELSERRTWAEKLQGELNEKAAFIAGLQKEFAEQAEWIKKLDKDIAERDARILERHAAVEKLEEELRGSLAERQAAVEKLEAELKDRSAWAMSLQAQINERDARIIERQQEVVRLEAEMKARAEWALGLDREVQALRQSAIELEGLRADMQQMLGSVWYRTGKRLRLSPVPVVDQRRPS